MRTVPRLRLQTQRQHTRPSQAENAFKVASIQPFVLSFMFPSRVILHA